MYVKTGERINSFFLIKEIKKDFDRNYGDVIRIHAISDIEKNHHTILFPLKEDFKEMYILGSLIRIEGTVDERGKIIAESITSAYLTLPFISIEPILSISAEEIVTNLKKMIENFEALGLADILSTIIKCYEEELLKATPTACWLRKVEYPSHLHAAYSLIRCFERFAKQYSQVNFETLFALSLINLLKPLRINLDSFLEAFNDLIPVYSEIFRAVLFREKI